MPNLPYRETNDDLLVDRDFRKGDKPSRAAAEAHAERLKRRREAQIKETQRRH